MAAAAPVIGYALLAAGTVAAGYASYSSGQAQLAQYKLKQRQEASAARDREIYRKQELLKALALRAVAQGASGTTMEGTPRELVLNDFKNYELDRTRGYANAAALQASLRAAGENAAKVGTIEFGASLFSAASSYYKGTSGLAGGKINNSTDGTYGGIVRPVTGTGAVVGPPAP